MLLSLAGRINLDNKTRIHLDCRLTAITTQLSTTSLVECGAGIGSKSLNFLDPVPIYTLPSINPSQSPAQQTPEKMEKITDKIAALPPHAKYFSLEFFPPKTQMVG